MDIKERTNNMLNRLFKSKFFEVSSLINTKIKGKEFILNYLYRKNEDVSAGELANALNVSTARIAVLLKKLIKYNFVYKYSSLDDARIVMVSITEIGRKHIERENKGILDYFEQIIDHMGIDKVENFINSADELLLAIEPMRLEKNNKMRKE